MASEAGKKSPAALRRCPKCGGEDIHVCYVNGKQWECDSKHTIGLGPYECALDLRKGEHLHQNCRDCGYLVGTPLWDAREAIDA